MSEKEEQPESQPTLSLKIKDIELDKDWPSTSDICLVNSSCDSSDNLSALV